MSAAHPHIASHQTYPHCTCFGLKHVTLTSETLFCPQMVSLPNLEFNQSKDNGALMCGTHFSSSAKYKDWILEAFSELEEECTGSLYGNGG